VLYIIPGQEAKFLAPLDVRDIPGVGKVTEQKLHTLGILTVGDVAKLDDSFLEEHLGKWGLALAGKARGEDAGGWFDGVIGEEETAKSISHEHTYNEDTTNVDQIESTLMRLSEMVGRRLRDQQFHARTLQLKLRYKDFTTITRAHTLDSPTQLDNEIFREIHRLFHTNWRRGAEVRLLGVQASSFGEEASQGNLLEDQSRGKWQQALSAADRVRDKFGESSITLGTGMKGGFRERTHENPAALPGKSQSNKKQSG
jgi:DNA polymerase-4